MTADQQDMGKQDMGQQDMGKQMRAHWGNFAREHQCGFWDTVKRL